MAITASIHALAVEDPIRAEAAAWNRFSVARDGAEFTSGWLAILCTQIDRVNGALLILGPDEAGDYTPAAMWPDPSKDLTHLGATATRALAERKGIVTGPDGTSPPARDQAAHIGYPIEIAGVLHGVVVLDVAPAGDQALQHSLRLVHWASAWLIDLFRQRTMRQNEGRMSRMSLAMDIVATAMRERRFSASALAVANELTRRLDCDRASLGVEKSGSIEVRAISHSATFDAKMSLVRLISAAMDETLDLETTIVLPPRSEDPPGAVAHVELARQLKSQAICSVALRVDGHATGVLMLERSADHPFDLETVELCETLGALLGPILDLKQDNEQSVWRRIRSWFGSGSRALVGPRHPGAKLIALSVLVLALTLTFVTGSYRISARSVVEGAIQRAAVAPFDGHILQSQVRAGDIVRGGDVLCRLDDRELSLENTKLSSERDQLNRKYRQALSIQDRPGMAVLAAQIAEAEAQLALIGDKLARATLRAPFDGVVVSGDLSQLLGTPVEQGKLLFQIAPLESYRVILEIDERDIASLAEDQGGEMMLSGIPGEHMPFTVRRITPVSTSQEGRNFFRVEAQLKTPSDRLRPGMEGIGKVEVDQRRMIWIWTHGLSDWLRVWIWKTMP
jgi:RND family efflux transporter MFP subunit